MNRLLILTLLLSLPGTAAAGDQKKPVKVFILAGQSNMEGKAPNTLLEHQANDPKTKALFAHLRKDGKWIVRDDVVRVGPFNDEYRGADAYVEFLAALMPTLPGYSMEVSRITYADDRAFAELAETVGGVGDAGADLSRQASENAVSAQQRRQTQTATA